MTATISHNDAVKSALLAAAKCGAMVFRREVGLFYDQRGNPRKVGFPGEADVQGILRGGRAIAIEIKTGAARRTEEQKRWARRFIELGGLYVLARYSDRESGDQLITEAITSPEPLTPDGEFVTARNDERNLNGF